MTKKRVLFILHWSPPSHGASRVGDIIRDSEKVNGAFACRYVKIKSSTTIGDIGKVNPRKLYHAVELYLKVLFALLTFRPDVVYVTVSVRSVAFLRDVLLSTLWKSYAHLRGCKVYYHYHTRGVEEFVAASGLNRALTRFLLSRADLILLSPLLEPDFDRVRTFAHVHHVPNGVEDPFTGDGFEVCLHRKDFSSRNVLFLSNMIRSKGYLEVLDLARRMKGSGVEFHFAGDWQDDADREGFFDYIESNHLADSVHYHGFVEKEDKRRLFEAASVLVFPTRLEAFGLVVVEALAHGVPVLASDEGSLPFIVTEECGRIISDMKELEGALRACLECLVNPETSMNCRRRYLERFTLDAFESRLVEVLAG